MIQAALEALNVAAPGPDDPPLARAEALGLLLFVVEGELSLESDPIGLDYVKAGYFSGIATVAKLLRADSPSEVERWYRQMYTQLLDERLMRTGMEIHLLWNLLEEDTFSFRPAADALMSAVLPLLRTMYPEPGASEDEVAKRIRDALRRTRTDIQTARQHVEDGRKELKRLGFQP